MSDELNDSVWRTANTIQEIVAGWNRAEHYVLPLLFVRFLEDWHAETLEEYRKKYRGDVIRIGRAMRRERFIVPDDCTLESLRNRSDIGVAINRALLSIEQANPHKLGGVLASANYNHPDLGEMVTRNGRLLLLLQALAEPVRRARGTEWVRMLADLLIRVFAEEAGRRRGYVITPTELVDLMVQLVQPVAGDRIYDPACGAGGLLTHAARATGGGNFALFGNEPSEFTWALCRRNLLLQGMDLPRVEQGNPVSHPILTADDKLQKFDVILTNPPLSSAGYDPEALKEDRLKRFARGIPPKGTGDYVLISHIVESLHPTHGRACVVVPLGALFRAGSERLIRSRLIEQGLLDGVIRLPPNLLHDSTLAIALLMFRTNRSDKSVFFIDASRNFSDAKLRNKLRKEDLEKLVAAWRTRADEPGYSYRATFKEIETAEFNLNVSLYVQAPSEDGVDLQAVRAEIRTLEEQLVSTGVQLTAALDALRE